MTGHHGVARVRCCLIWQVGEVVVESEEFRPLNFGARWT
jgi:hypothetical protein